MFVILASEVADYCSPTISIGSVGAATYIGGYLMVIGHRSVASESYEVGSASIGSYVPDRDKGVAESERWPCVSIIVAIALHYELLIHIRGSQSNTRVSPIAVAFTLVHLHVTLGHSFSLC